MANVLGVITARGGSKGIPKKNIKLLGGKPLIAYTIEAAKKSRLLTCVVVSTDTEEIAKVAKEWGAEVPFLRPAELADDQAGHVGVMQHALKFMEAKLGVKFDYTVILQPTSPFRLPEDLDLTIQKAIDTGFDSSVSLVEIEEGHPWKIKKLAGDRVLPYFEEEKEGTRRQDLPKYYKRSGAAYVTSRKTLMENNQLYGEKVAGHVVTGERSIDIDTPFDWLKAEMMLADLKKKGYEF